MISNHSSAGPPSGGHDVGDELLVPLLYGLLRRHVDEVHKTYGPRLPRLRSEEFYTAPEHVQVAVLLVLGSAWLFGTPGLALVKDVSLDVNRSKPRGYWARAAAEPTFAELQRRRGLHYDPQAQRWVAA